MEGYADLNEFITITKDKTTTHTFTLKKNYAGLKVVSDPAGATVYLDGEDLGTTPIDRDDLSPGEATLIIELDGYESSTQPVRLKTGETSEVKVYLTIQTGSIEITTIPTGAEVFVDGEKVGTYESSPLKVENLSLGEHNATARLVGHIVSTSEFLVVFRKDVSLKLILKPKDGRIIHILRSYRCTDYC